MSEGEQKLVDTSGDYRYAVKNGQPVGDADWRSCRIVLTSERMVLATSGGKQAIPHARIMVPEDPDGVLPEGVDAAASTALEIGDNVILIDAQAVDDFESEYCRAALHDEVILVKHPAVVGGVIQDEATWSKCQFRLDDDTVTIGLPGGETLTFDIGNVGTIDTDDQQVMGEARTVVKVEHTDDEDRSVETHFSGMAWHSRALGSLLRTVIDERQDDYELSETERQVLMALYSGVSPFEISDFVGIDVDQVEEIYQRLLDVGAVDKVRERTEVTLNAQGRNMASEAMSEE
ncbi:MULTISPECIES: CheF family chemotaxis protein [Salinibaculum]|uniref:CheF family chemotaxis protein n=1 Tax=Salinibaculum TaxID=2732368 RepID=UPI0030D326AA